MVAVKDNIKVNDRYRVDLPEPFYIRSGRHILSKEEELDCPTPGFKSGRTASHVTIMLEDNTTKLHLLSTHLGCEWTNENRMEQARFLLNRVIELADETFILGGDFNAWPNATEVQLFTRSDVGRNVFDDLRWELPKYTCWVGTPVDYIFAGRALHGKVSGAYVYYTLASDHLPLIADFDISIARFF
jgi:endonuclease/exonuclease/phosphatase family metal-dependent hydrolase